ncbi:MAG TPA: PIN domain-containing protein [Rhizomicrobium sp.]|jgi:predicted nucleic acid-binding protein|nr:PIN domain-containing protein [Rhizomicrobium sp.]
MFLIDTCVVSEGNRVHPNEDVDDWLAAQKTADMFISAVSIGEIRYGVDRLPFGKKRSDLERWFDEIVLVGFVGRIVDFDLKAALHWADIRAAYPNAKLVDAQIAASAIVSGLTLATRNVKDFPFRSLSVFNPWQSAG